MLRGETWKIWVSLLRWPEQISRHRKCTEVPSRSVALVLHRVGTVAPFRPAREAEQELEENKEDAQRAEVELALGR